MSTHEARADQNSEPQEQQAEAIAPGECKPIRTTLKKPTGERPGFFYVDRYNFWMTGGARKKYL